VRDDDSLRRAEYILGYLNSWSGRIKSLTAGLTHSPFTGLYAAHPQPNVHFYGRRAVCRPAPTSAAYPTFLYSVHHSVVSSTYPSIDILWWRIFSASATYYHPRQSFFSCLIYAEYSYFLTLRSLAVSYLLNWSSHQIGLRAICLRDIGVPLSEFTSESLVVPNPAFSPCCVRSHTLREVNHPSKNVCRPGAITAAAEVNMEFCEQ
jgi:hypothetical protein